MWIVARISDAWITPIRSTARTSGRAERFSSRCRARSARFSSRVVSTRSTTRGVYPRSDGHPGDGSRPGGRRATCLDPGALLRPGLRVHADPAHRPPGPRTDRGGCSARRADLRGAVLDVRGLCLADQPGASRPAGPPPVGHAGDGCVLRVRAGRPRGVRRGRRGLRARVSPGHPGALGTVAPSLRGRGDAAVRHLQRGLGSLRDHGRPPRSAGCLRSVGGCDRHPVRDAPHGRPSRASVPHPAGPLRGAPRPPADRGVGRIRGGDRYRDQRGLPRRRRVRRCRPRLDPGRRALVDVLRRRRGGCRACDGRGLRGGALLARHQRLLLRLHPDPPRGVRRGRRGAGLGGGGRGAARRFSGHRRGRPRSGGQVDASAVKPRFFRTAGEFRAWLERNHDRTAELWVGFHRKATGKPSITWPEAVDQALCFGWIDGIRKRIDETSYMNRFTPRRPTSTWSEVNVRRVRELTEEGLMTPAGVGGFEGPRGKPAGVYSYEERPQELPPKYARSFRSNAAAWKLWRAMPPSYRKAATWWVISAKREETRERRLATLIETRGGGGGPPALPPPARR